MLVLWFFLCVHIIVGLQQAFESDISLSDTGTTFIPKYSFESTLATVNVPSQLRCGQQCNQNILCRIFIYEKIIVNNCRLYQSDLSSGNITSTGASSSRVGIIVYHPLLYADYNQTCDWCQFNRYLTCQNATCRCPPPTSYWDGQMCQNQLYYGEACNASSWCRQDLNLACVFGSCQPNTASMTRWSERENNYARTSITENGKHGKSLVFTLYK